MPALCVTLALSALLLRLSLPSAASAKESGTVIKKQGDVLTMACTMETDQERVHLTVTRPKMHTTHLSYDGKTKKLDYSDEYRGRVKSRGDLPGLTISISDLQPGDSGLYACHHNGTQEHSGAEGSDVFLVVKERCPESKREAVPESLVLLLIVTACAVLLLCALAVLVWMGPKVKALCLSRGDNVTRTINCVYEDMHIHRVQLND